MTHLAEPVRLGVIGCGVIAQRHLEGAKESPLIEVVAVADIREEAARQTAGTFGVSTVYSSAEQLLDDERVEAVVLAMPADVRTKIALRAFARGKHVLTEKPVAMTGAEVKRMIEAKGKLVGGCCSSRHQFLPSAESATKFIAGGVLGPLRTLHCRCFRAAGERPKTSPPAWRLSNSMNGGGVLANWGCYDLDYLLGLTGWSLRPRLVLAQTWKVPPQFEAHVAPGSDAETHFAAFVLCEGGTVITIERGEYMASQSENAWQIVGTKGSLHLQMRPGQGKKIVHDDTTPESGVASSIFWEGDENSGPSRVGPVLDFAAAIREGRQPRTSLEQALIIQKITDGIYASAAQGTAVEIN